MCAAVAVGLLIAGVIFLLVRLAAFRRPARPGLGSFLRIAAACVCLVVGLVALPIYWLAVKVGSDPLVLPQATLSNGTRTVVFQGMVHIGSEGFYKTVVYDLEEALSEGYHLYYEGVQPGGPEADAWFARELAGGGDLGANYQAMADACGLRFQLDYFQLLLADREAHPERHVDADVSTADMMREWERLKAVYPELDSTEPEPAEAESLPLNEMIDWIATLDSRQRELVGVVCRGFFTVALGRKPETEAEGLGKVILDYRNLKLAERIAGDPHDKIFVTYGAAHLPGLIADLKAADPAWELKSVTWLRAIAAPEELEGTL